MKSFKLQEARQPALQYLKRWHAFNPLISQVQMGSQIGSTALVAHPVGGFHEAFGQAGAQCFGHGTFAHRLVHAGDPLVALFDADGKRHVAHAQARVAKALLVVVGAAQPAAQKPEQFLARIVQRVAVRGAQFCVSGFEFHQVVKALDQRAHLRLAADVFERGGGVHGHRFCVVHVRSGRPLQGPLQE